MQPTTTTNLRRYHWLRQLLLLLTLLITGATAHAFTTPYIKIDGLTPTGEYNGYPYYTIPEGTTSVTVSSTGGQFDYIFIDGNQIAYNSSSYWSSRSISISSYLDGEIHSVYLQRGSSDYGYCYFSSSDLAESSDYFIIVEDNEAKVIGASLSLEEANIPASIVKEGVTYPVTAIGAYAFKNQTNLQSVTIPETIKSIGNSAFYGCSSLTAVTIPENVTSIGDSAFQGCSSLTSVSIPENVTSIERSTFSGCSSLTAVTLPENVTSIGESAFQGCSSLTSVSILENVTSIGGFAFQGCSSLTAVTIPENVTSIGESAFSGCSSLTSISIPKNVSSIGKSAFSDCTSLTCLEYNAVNCEIYGLHYNPAFPSSISEIKIGEEVTCIPNYFLYNGSQIENLVLPESLTSIGSYAFINSSKITTVIIPKNVTSIGSYAFNGCSSLIKSAYPNSISNPFSETFSNGIFICYPSQCFIDEMGVIYDSEQRKVFFAPLTLSGSYQLPENLTSIGERAFSRCSSLLEITIPNDVSTIEAGSFSGCNSISAIIIPEKVTSIGDGAFYGCNSLTSLNFEAKACDYCGSSESPAFPSTINELSIGSKLTMIPSNFLFRGSQITYLVFPPSLTSIGNRAFGNNSSLKKITIPENVTYIGGAAFTGCTALDSLEYNAIDCTLHSSMMAFPTTLRFVEFGNKVTRLPKSILHGNDQIERVVVPNSVTEIGSCAFYNNKLKSVVIGAGVRSIATDAFSRSNSTHQITKAYWLCNTPPEGASYLRAKINFVGNNQFSNLSNTRIYQFLSSNFTVDGTVFVPVSPSERTCDVIDCAYDPSFSELIISDKVTNKGIEFSVQKINAYSYYGNKYITSANISNDDFVGSEAFYNCVNLESLEIRNNGNIGTEAFSSCNSLQIATISNRGDLGSSAFENCGSLQSTEITNNGSIGASAFNNCTNLQAARVCNNGNIGNSAFAECQNLENLVLGDSVKAIENNCFKNCAKIQELTIPNSISYFGEYAFTGCSKLKRVYFGKGTKELPRYIFNGCSSLDSLSVPGNFNKIGDYAFSGCTSLSDLSLEELVVEEEESQRTELSFPDWTSTNHSDGSTSYKEYSFEVINGDELTFNYTVDSEGGYDKLIVNINNQNVLTESGNKSGTFQHQFTQNGPITLYIAYYKDSSGSSGTDKATVSDIRVNGTEASTILRLGSNGSSPLFADCPLEEVYIGRNLSYNSSSSYGYSPFYRNASLKKVVISDVEDQISDNEFYGCSNLESITIGNGVTSIGKWAFSGCSSLDYFSAGYNVKSIGDEAFSDCTALKNYYSFSPEPPVCGANALDDINKWECTLFVPAESSEEYMAAPQWKEFFFVNETDAVLIESLGFEETELRGLTGDTYQLNAQIEPANATRKRLDWSSDDPDVAAVDENGLVSFVKEGNTVITARTRDGSGLEASVEVTVSVKNPETGDSNGNGVINVADAVNIANYVIGNEVAHIDMTAADVNGDGKVTISDASALVTMILDQPAEAPVMHRQAAQAQSEENGYGFETLTLDDFEGRTGDTVVIPVKLANARDYVAMQGEVVVPEGMEIVEVASGEAATQHMLQTRRINNRTLRVVLFDLNNTPFGADDEAILWITAKVNEANDEPVKVSKALVADADANEMQLFSTGGFNNVVTGMGAINSALISITPEAGAIVVKGANGAQITVTDMMGRTMATLMAESDNERIPMPSGIYIVTAARKTAKVIIK